MKVVPSSGMKLSSALVLLLFVTGTMLMHVGTARRCTGRVNGNMQEGVCAPRSICPSGRPRRRSSRCDGGTRCCIGPVLRCPRNNRFFVTVRGECRPGNDRGRVSPDAPNNIRCCRNQPAPLPWVRSKDDPALLGEVLISWRSTTAELKLDIGRLCLFTPCNKDFLHLKLTSQCIVVVMIVIHQ